MDDYRLTNQQVTTFRHDGFLMLRDYFARGDIDQLLAIARSDPAMERDAHAAKDQAGRTNKLNVRHRLRPCENPNFKD